MRRKRKLDVMLMTTTLVLVAAVFVAFSIRLISNSSKDDQAVFIPLSTYTSPLPNAEEREKDLEVEGLINRHHLDVEHMKSSSEDTVDSETSEETAPSEESTSSETAPTTVISDTTKPPSTTKTSPGSKAFKSVDIRYYANSEAGLNMREGPSTKSKVIRKLDYGTPLRVIELNDEWAKVRLSGLEFGYVSRDFITKYRPETTPTVTSTTTTTTKPTRTRTTTTRITTTTEKVTASSTNPKSTTGTGTSKTATTATTTRTTLKPPEGGIKFVNPPAGGSNSVARTNHGILKKYGLINKEGSPSINRHYATFSDNGDGTITVDGITIPYVQSMPGRRATHYDGVEVCRFSIRRNGGRCFAGHTTPTCHNTGCGLLAQRGIVAVSKADAATYPRGSVVFVVGYGMAVVGDRSGSHFDVCYDADESSKLTRSNWTSGIYIITSP